MLLLAPYPTAVLTQVKRNTQGSISSFPLSSAHNVPLLSYILSNPKEMFNASHTKVIMTAKNIITLTEQGGKNGEWGG